MRRQIELAKRLLESKGYTVSKIKEGMTPDEVDDAIEKGKPFDMESFKNAHPDHQNTEGAIRADEVEVGDKIKTDFDASEINRGTEIEVVEVGEHYYGYSEQDFEIVVKAKVLKTEGQAVKVGDIITLHYDENDYVGYVLNDEVNESTEEGIDDRRWEPFSDGKYRVHGSSSIGREDIDDVQTLNTDDPGEAIEAWFRISQKTPTETSIMTQTKSNAQELIDWAADNIDKIEVWYDKYNSPYEKEYIINSIMDRHESGVKYFYESPSGFGDQIFPFSLG